ncbi:Pyruvate:ferredoxin (Flavodoxin) oxidoreductase [Propionibacterium freudenreichii]|uniref:pyruvate:ferredoxin (flavodoxin) oxidoreductase n=1 Tax=Propionibacterium freudenreichii TaxID=1744 RepID=UPI0005A5C997|nr:pyruvate:ferredoxin (flavodoxin) oxidoreductase [Propionibacterium freudenreichii]CEI23847.1 Pyruvate:ferredoxin (Flavodoxin) oxidoreductase [Propionibacterium freudenreichii]
MTTSVDPDHGTTTSARPTASAGQHRETMDGNEAAARVAHAFSEVIAVYPITPSSAMAESCDAWSAAGRTNLWGGVPQVVEMQSEAGAAGALHGAVTKGVLGTTFTASQGLLLMIPNMYKIAGELTPAVIHVAARAVATHALSIFGDHSDVMAVRQTGWGMLASASVQEAHDLAAVAHAATLRTRVPFVHFFDGFRTSHEVNTIETLTRDDLTALVREDDVSAHRERGLTPDAPMLRGTAQNPDVFFQAREAANPFYDVTPSVVQEVMDELAERSGRQYHLVDYHGAPDSDRVIVIMGSGGDTARETVDALNAAGQKLGVLQVRLFRPFPTEQLAAALPTSVRHIAVLDRTKEPGSAGEPLLADVITALADEADHFDAGMPKFTGGRYGLSSKEFTPAMVKAVFDDLATPAPHRRFTVGINDDVSHLSLPVDDSFTIDHPGLTAVFYGLGSDGTVGASKNSVKIIAADGRYGQGYFVYDSRKSGATTVSHLRFGDKPIDAPYLIDAADFVAVHQFELLEKMPTLDLAKPGAKVLINSPFGADSWAHLPVEIQQIILDRKLDVWVIDATAIAIKTKLGHRINTIMQPCYFYLSGVVDQAEAIPRIKESIDKTYGRRGRVIVERNFAAVDAAIKALSHLEVPAGVVGDQHRMAPLPDAAPDFVKRVTGAMLRGEGDALPVSALPVDGTWPIATSKYEKRCIATDIPIWDESLCIDCGKCAITCPHAAIRIKVAPEAEFADAPQGFKSKNYRDRKLAGHRLVVQVAPDDCTGCGICVDVCPAKSKTEVKHKSLNMEPRREHLETERANFDFFLGLPEIDRSKVRHDQVKGVAQLQPLFEFSLACSGCGETPYIRTLTQLFGDRMLIANATGCSSIYGGNLPTAPYVTNAAGRGPAWSNSLFEDNAEFGLGMRLGWEQQNAEARRLLEHVGGLDADLVGELLGADQHDEPGIDAQRERVTRLKEALADRSDATAQRLATLADELVEKSVWIIGGDGWAYDIGSGGLDHVLGSGHNVNVLVLDTEVYSNTGGQASKATPRAAAAKFAPHGKASAKKDLGMIAQAYGDVYVAQVAIGANQQQTVRALSEAQAWDGPSLIIAYSTCIAHGIDMETSMTHQGDAVRTGYWPLYRFRPSEDADAVPLHMDSRAPMGKVADFMGSEARFAMLQRAYPDRARELGDLAQADADERWRYYSQLAGVTRVLPAEREGAADDDQPVTSPTPEPGGTVTPPSGDSGAAGTTKAGE